MSKALIESLNARPRLVHFSAHFLDIAFGLLPYVAIGVMTNQEPKIMVNMVSGLNSSMGRELIGICLVVQVATLILGFLYSLRLKSMFVTVLMRSAIFFLAFVGFVFVMSTIVFAPAVLGKLNDQRTQATPALMVSGFLDLLGGGRRP